ncbi:hypothetical protein EDC01DRAFT_748280 [Geopyxis carbonaria]|nr:hypothetical protein EDC01DRAFT_748280 [Geopyxis carbonaria]
MKFVILALGLALLIKVVAGSPQFGFGRGRGRGRGEGCNNPYIRNKHSILTYSTVLEPNKGNRGNNQGNGNGGAGNGLTLQLDPQNVQPASSATGQEVDSDPAQKDSATDEANFINFCSGKEPKTNGQQEKGGSCNSIVMGDIPSTDNMVSTIITSPSPGEDIAENTKFTVNIQVKNLQAGSFTNPDNTYYAAPQALNKKGQVIGHTHVTIQDLGGSWTPNQPPDATQFRFFKGVNDDGDGQGGLQAVVEEGLKAGFYRVCTMTSSSNHQVVLMPIAQRGAQDDCQKFTVGQGGIQGNNGNNIGQKKGDNNNNDQDLENYNAAGNNQNQGNNNEHGQENGSNENNDGSFNDQDQGNNNKNNAQDQENNGDDNKDQENDNAKDNQDINNQDDNNQDSNQGVIDSQGPDIEDNATVDSNVDTPESQDNSQDENNSDQNNRDDNPTDNSDGVGRIRGNDDGQDGGDQNESFNPNDASFQETVTEVSQTSSENTAAETNSSIQDTNGDGTPDITFSEESQSEEKSQTEGKSTQTFDEQGNIIEESSSSSSESSSSSSSSSLSKSYGSGFYFL